MFTLKELLKIKETVVFDIVLSYFANMTEYLHNSIGVQWWYQLTAAYEN